MKSVSVLWLVAGLYLAACLELCPPNLTCVTSETPDSCPNGSEFKFNAKLHGCCPGCVYNLSAVKEPCDEDLDCGRGLSCVNQNNCTVDKTRVCERFLIATPNYKFWIPSCMPDGTFAPKQCKGEKLSGKCFCYDQGGNRIFGESAWSKSENMTCACSRQMAESTRLDSSLHCNDQGNYEALQCDDGLCWCADDKTGVPYTIIVPEKMMQFLPCYNSDDVGSQYLRRCDSVKVNQAHAAALMSVHGTDNIFFQPVSCNYDGSFGKVQVINNKKTCTYKDKVPIQDGVEITAGGVNCNCAYDRFVTTQNGGQFLFDCEINGNYKKEQRTAAGDLFCVDLDGMAYTDIKVTKC